MNVLVKLPTRGRPAKFLSVLNAAIERLSGEHDVKFLVACDHDDELMVECAREYVFDGPGNASVEFRFGHHSTKIEACNSFLPGDWPWDVVVLLSDDMIPIQKHWDSIICSDMARCFPDFDGALHYNDGFVGERCCTLSIMGRAYFDRFGYIYEPGYRSLFCDNEFTDVGRSLSRIRYFSTVLFRHDHPGNIGGPKDDLYDHNDKAWDADQCYYNGRKVRRFDLPVLDILICTIPTRADLLEVVHGQLTSQIKRAGLETNVRVIVERDSDKMTIGTKRNVLVSRSRAEYVCHVDDDDQVSPDYVASIVRAIGNCDVDCVALVGRIRSGSERQENWHRFVHSIQYNRYTQLADNTYVRPPNHLNPIRRKIVVQFPFQDISHGEDTDFALRMCRRYALKTERFASQNPIYSYVPSFWYAKRLGRCDGHAAVNLHDPASWPELEQNRRSDSLPPEDFDRREAIPAKPEDHADPEDQALKLSAGDSVSTTPIQSVPVMVEIKDVKKIPPTTSTSQWRSEGAVLKEKLRRLRNKGK